MVIEYNGVLGVKIPCQVRLWFAERWLQKTVFSIRNQKIHRPSPLIRARYNGVLSDYVFTIIKFTSATEAPDGDAARFACDIDFCTCSSIVIWRLNFLRPSKFGLLLSFVLVFFNLTPLLISFNSSLWEFGFSDSKINWSLFFTTVALVIIGFDLRI